MSFENAVYQWRRGELRLRAEPPERRSLLERITDALVAELRRRLGGRFSAEELAQLYERDTGWYLPVAMKVAPEEPWAWEAGVVLDAAFGRYLREAADYVGGSYLERYVDRPVARPVLGVDRVVLDRGIEPQPIALLAVVEGSLQRAEVGPGARRSPAAAGEPAPASTAAPARARARRGRVS